MRKYFAVMTELHFLTLTLSGTFLTFIYLLATVELLIPIFLRRLDRSGGVKTPTVVAATCVWLLAGFVILGTVYLTVPWLAEGMLITITFYLLFTLTHLRRRARGTTTGSLDWLADHGVTRRKIRDLKQVQTTADLTAWACVVTLTAPIAALPPATWHRVDPAVYSGGVGAAFASGLVLIGCIALNDRLRVCDTLLRHLTQVCTQPVTEPSHPRTVDRWIKVYTSAVGIWREGRTSNERALEGARVCVYRLLKRRARELTSVDPIAFRQSGQFLVDDLADLANSTEDPRTSAAITRVIRVAVLGDLTVLGRDATRPASLTNDRAYSRWNLQKMVGLISLAAGLAASLLALADKV